MKRATRDKDLFVGDPAFIDVPVDRLTDKAYAAEMAAAIQAGEIAEVTRLKGVPEPKTTHISVVDEARLARSR